MGFKILSKEDVEGKKQLSIFEKISPMALATDVVNELGNGTKKECPYPYWLDSYHKYSEKEKTYLFDMHYTQYTHMNGMYVTETGDIATSIFDCKNIGVRLKVSYDEIEDQIIKDLSDNPYVVQEENGVKVFLALEWLQEFETNKQDVENLNALDKYGRLKKAKKEFTFPDGEKPKVVYYKQNMYAKVGDNWAKVSPIEWYYDEETNILVSKKVLAIHQMGNFSGRYMNKFSFELSELVHYIHNMEKESIMDKTEKDCYYSIPFALYDYQYEKELEEISRWETYKTKRGQRRQQLELLKRNILSIDNGESMAQMIDNIMKINEEDENIAEEVLRPKKHY